MTIRRWPSPVAAAWLGFAATATAGPGDVNLSGDLTVGGLTSAASYATPVCRDGSGTLGNCSSVAPQVATVSPSGGDCTSPVAAMNALGSWCGVPSATDRCLIALLPGVYDLGTDSLYLQDYVDLRGAGENMSIIRGQIQHYAVVVADSNSHIADLTIENNRGDSNALAVSVSGGAEPKLVHVTLRADSGAGFNSLALKVDGAYPTVTDSFLYAEGNQSVNVVRVVDSRVGNSGEAVRIMRSRLESGPADGTALNVNQSDVFVTDSELVSAGFAIYTWESTDNITYTVEVDGSELTSAGYLLGSYSTDYVLSFGASKLGGTNVSAWGGGILRCAASYTGSYVALNSSCQ